MNFETRLKEEIVSEIDELGKIEVGTDRFKVAVDSVSKLVDRAIELEKIEVERADKAYGRDVEADIQYKKLKIEQRDKIVGHVLTGITFIGGAALTVWGTIVSLDFEKTGTVSSFAGKEFISKLFPKKK